MLTSVADVVSLLHTKIDVLENKVKVHQYSDVQEVLQEPSAESVTMHQQLTIDVVYQALLGCKASPGTSPHVTHEALE